MKYSDEQRIQKILMYSKKLNDYIEENGITKEKLMREYALQWLVTTPLYNIGEHAYYISKEYKAEHSDIPWGMISGLQTGASFQMLFSRNFLNLFCRFKNLSAKSNHFRSQGGIPHGRNLGKALRRCQGGTAGTANLRLCACRRRGCCGVIQIRQDLHRRLH